MKACPTSFKEEVLKTPAQQGLGVSSWPSLFRTFYRSIITMSNEKSSTTARFMAAMMLKSILRRLPTMIVLSPPRRMGDVLELFSIISIISRDAEPLADRVLLELTQNGFRPQADPYGTPPNS